MVAWKEALVGDGIVAEGRDTEDRTSLGWIACYGKSCFLPDAAVAGEIAGDVSSREPFLLPRTTER